MNKKIIIKLLFSLSLSGAVCPLASSQESANIENKKRAFNPCGKSFVVIINI